MVKKHGKIIRHSPRTTDRAIATRELNKCKKSLAQIDSGAGQMTVKALADHYLDSSAHLDYKTLRTRKSIAKQFKATWPGGLEQIHPKCAQLRDPDVAGPAQQPRGQGHAR